MGAAQLWSHHAFRWTHGLHAVQDKVSTRSMEAAQLRRHLLRGSVIVFVTAGYSGKRFIFTKARPAGASTAHAGATAGLASVWRFRGKTSPVERP